MNDTVNREQTAAEPQSENADALKIRAEHRQAIARIESEREAELARLDLEATRRMPVAIRLFFDDRLYQRATQIAERMAEAEGITPPHLIGKPGACFAVVSKSLAWNLDPFSVAQSTYEVHGRVAYQGSLVQAVLEASGKLEGGIRAEYIGDWSKVDGQFRIEGNKPVRTWSDADEKGLGITLRCKIRGEDKPREFTFYLRQCFPRNASTWPTRPRQMMHYNAIRAFANTAAPSLLLGVPFRDEVEDDLPMRDVTPPEPIPAPEPVDLDQALSPGLGTDLGGRSGPGEHVDPETGEVAPGSSGSLGTEDRPQRSVRSSEPPRSPRSGARRTREGETVKVLGKPYRNLGSALTAIGKAVDESSIEDLMAFEDELRATLAILHAANFDPRREVLAALEKRYADETDANEDDGSAQDEPAATQASPDEVHAAFVTGMRHAIETEKPEFLIATRNRYLAAAGQMEDADEAVAAVEAAYAARTQGGGR